MSDLRPQALYRFFDGRGRLLYVGITLDLGARWDHHSKNKTWWTDVARCTVEHFGSRDAVLAAEKAAIIAEKPLWNVVHNGRARSAINSGGSRGTRQGSGAWCWNLRDGRNDFQEDLRLYWELNWDSISDDYYVDEISPIELWRLWRSKLPLDVRAEQAFGAGAQRIRWYVEGDSTFEGAPFQDQRNDPLSGSNFLDHYTWPVHAETGATLRWPELPVADRLWRHGRADKGGFIQELTGWKPSPLQPYVNIVQLEKMAGLA